MFPPWTPDEAIPQKIRDWPSMEIKRQELEIFSKDLRFNKNTELETIIHQHDASRLIGRATALYI